MPQVASSEKEGVPSSQVTIGPGGNIPDTPENQELIKLVESTPELSPTDLYVLALSFQLVPSNMGLGNRLAFIALDTIYRHPLVQQDLSGQSQSPSTGCPNTWACCVLKVPPWILDCSGCICPAVPPARFTVKRVPYAGVELLIEVTGNKTYAVLGVSPSKLKEKDMVQILTAG